MIRVTSSSLRVVVAVMAVGFCSFSDIVRAQSADDAFKEGFSARNAKRWRDVVTHMQQAVQIEASDSTRKVQLVRVLRVTLREMEYLPHFFIGEALFELGDCVGAMDEWLLSEQQKAVQTRAEYVTIMQNGYRHCGSRGILLPAELAPLREAATRSIADATSAMDRVARLRQANGDLWRSDTNDKFENAKRDIDNARGRVSEAERGRTRAGFTDARSTAVRAEGLLRDIEGTLNSGIRIRSAVDQQAADVERIITGARDTDSAIDGTSIVLPPELRSTRQGGHDQLERAVGRLSDGRRAQNLATVGEARRLASEASSSLTQVLEGARALQSELLSKASEEALQRAVDRAVAAARQVFSFADATLTRIAERLLKRPDRATLELTAKRDDLQKQLDGLRGRLERARQAKNEPGVLGVRKSADAVRALLDELAESFGPVTIEERVGIGLYAGATAFLKGDYAKTLETLDSANGSSDSPLQAHVHLFRAASLFMLYVRSGEKDEALLTRANEEIGRARELDPGLVPHGPAFSPRFVGAYRNGGIQAAATPVPAPTR